MKLEDRGDLSFLAGPPEAGWSRRLLGGAGRWLPQRWRLGARYEEFRRLAEEAEAWPVEQIQEYQFKQLRQTLIQAGNYCRFYQRAFAKAVFRPELMRSFDDLRECPCLTRQDLIQHTPELLSTAFPEKARLSAELAEAAGTPVSFHFQKDVSQPKERAFLEAQWKRAGCVERARLAVICGSADGPEARSSVARRDAARGWLLLSSAQLAPERLPEYLDALEKFKPDFLHASPTVALRLAGWLESAGPPLRLPLRGLLCGSGPLTHLEKRRLERAFQCRVQRGYGNAERAVLAGEGRQSELLYFCPAYGYVEFGPPDGEGWCEILATSFHNLVLPLIRYRTGDVARLADPRTDGDLEFPWPAVSEVVRRAGATS